MNQSPAPVAGAVEAKRLFREAMHLSAHDSPLRTDMSRFSRLAKITKATAAVDAAIDRLAALHPQPAPAVAVEDAVALLTVKAADDPIWPGMNFIGLTEAGRALPAGKYELHAAAPAVAERVPLTEEPAGDGVEREDFETWMLTQGYGPRPRICGEGSPCEGEYANQYWHKCWDAWQERGDRARSRFSLLDKLARNRGFESVTKALASLPPAPPTVGSGSATEGQAK